MIIKKAVIIALIMSTGFLGRCFEVEAFVRDVRWKEVYTEHFRVIYAERHRELVKYLAKMVEAVHQEMNQFFEFPDQMITDVVVTDHIDRFDRFKLDILRKPESYVILHLGDTTAGAPSFDIHVNDWLVLQFIYQYTSVLRHSMDTMFRSLVSEVYPDLGFSGWMDGGMALYMVSHLQGGSGRSPYFDMFLRTGLLETAPEDLADRAATGYKIWPGDTGLFLYGSSFLRYLSDTYGANLLAEVNRSQSDTIPIPFTKNAFERIYGKDLQTLQQEWLVSLHATYQAQIQDIQARPMTPSQPLTDSGYFTGAPVFSPDGQYVYYIDDGPDDARALMQLRLSDRRQVRLTEGNFSGSFSVSADGQRLYFCKTEVYRSYYQRSDLYVLDLTRGRKGKVSRLTKGSRAFDPVISPDNHTLVYVTIDAGTTSLMQLDLEHGATSTLLTLPGHAQIRQPAFSSDGTRLAAQISKADGKQDIYLMDQDGGKLHPLTEDYAVDGSPVWGPEDRYLFFHSDRFGVPNIFAYCLEDKQLFQVTNVLTGAFAPVVSPDRQLLVFQKYSSQGMDIHLTDLMPARWVAMPFSQNRASQTVTERFTPVQTSQETRYKARSTLWPGFSPLWDTDEDGLQLGLNMSGEDTLGHHAYSIDALYGVGSKRLAINAEYMNNQWYPAIWIFAYDRASMYSGLFRNARGYSEDYWERQKGGGIEIGFPLYRSRKTDCYLTAGYDYQQIESLMKPYELRPPLPDEGALGSASSRLVWKFFNQSRFSISPESGLLTSVRYRRYDEMFGSDFNIDEVTGDLNLFLPTPFRHHVMLLRGAGGISNGDTLQQGIFQLGGFLFDFETELIYQPHFLLRGYSMNAFAGDRFVLGTAEYRFPLWYVQKSSWQGLMFWDHIAASLFMDAGYAWKNGTEDFDLKYSAGAEAALNIGYKYGRLPLGLHVGVAHGFDEDEGITHAYFRFILNL